MLISRQAIDLEDEAVRAALSVRQWVRTRTAAPEVGGRRWSGRNSLSWRSGVQWVLMGSLTSMWRGAPRAAEMEGC